MVKTRIWVTIISVLLLISAALCLWLWLRPAAGTVANIYLDGECVRSVDLSNLVKPYTFTVTSDRGENVIEVEPGRIRILSADCPDQICVGDGWLSDSAAPIVCLPHRLVIELAGDAAGDTGLDSIAR